MPEELPDEAPHRGAEGASLGPALVAQLGGKRGLVDSGLPAVVFVGVNAVVAAFAGRTVALRSAIAAAVASALIVIVLRLVRHEPVQQALSGLLGLALAVFFAARSGQARDFFKPGIYINAAYGLVFLGSALVRRPLVGAIYAAVEGLGAAWRTDRRLLRVFRLATVGWALVFAFRAVVQTIFYNADRPDLLAVSRLLLGWPLTIGAVAITLAYVRRSQRRAAGTGELPISLR